MTASQVAVVSLMASVVAAAAEAGFGSPSHEFTHFPVPNGVGDIAVGPAGDVWFTGDDRIGRLRAGVVTEFATPTAISSPQFIPAGPDGNTWFPSTTRAPSAASPTISSPR